MKRINPQTNQPFRSGEINMATGQVFRQYNTKRLRRDGFYQEIWILPELHAAMVEKMRLRARARRNVQNHLV